MLNIFNLHPKPEPQYIGSIKSELKELKLGDTIELFNAAYESYKILTSSDTNKESFLKDWAFLEKRWKVVNWIWHRNGFQTILSVVHSSVRGFDLFISKSN